MSWRLRCSWIAAFATALAALGPAGIGQAATCGPGTYSVGSRSGAVCISASSLSTLGSRPPSADVAKLEQQVNDTTSELHDVYVVFGIIFAVGFGGAAFSWFTTTRRESKLAIAGETASQDRAHAMHGQFLSQVTQAKQTLELVNQTLALAESASRRAAEAIEEKARETQLQLDTAAHELLDEVRHRDDRVLVAEPELRERLMALAEKVSGFQNSQFFLPVTISITPRCKFIAGMAAHVKGHYDEAFANWEAVALASKVTPELESAARYWIGYENNNLGRFERAEASFQLALDAITSSPTASVGRAYDIRRIMIETAFFADADEQMLIPMLEKLLGELSAQPQTKEIAETTAHVSATLGNVCHIAAGKATDPDTAIALYSQAALLFEAYKDTLDWARFGLAEALYQIPERREEAITLFREEVRRDAQREFDRREEARSKFRARLQELIVCSRVPEFSHEAESLSANVRDALAPLEERLTVYSLLKRKNVHKNLIREQELPELLREAELVGAQGGTSAPPTR